MLFGFPVQIEQHDHEKEKHHDRSRIHYDMRDRQELRIQKDVMTGDGEETGDQRKHTIHGAFGKDHHQCTDQRQGRQDVKHQLAHSLLVLFLKGWFE